METQEPQTPQNQYDNEAFREAVRKEVEKTLRATITASLCEKMATYMEGLQLLNSAQEL